jgi:hypothetical protein
VVLAILDYRDEPGNDENQKISGHFNTRKQTALWPAASEKKGPVAKRYQP